MEGLSRSAARAAHQARRGRAQYSSLEAQSTIQSRKDGYKTASREDWLRALAKAGRAAPCATRFAEYGLAKYLISWFCRLHADLGIRSRVTTID